MFIIIVIVIIIIINIKVNVLIIVDVFDLRVVIELWSVLETTVVTVSERVFFLLERVFVPGLAVALDLGACFLLLVINNEFQWFVLALVVLAVFLFVLVYILEKVAQQQLFALFKILFGVVLPHFADSNF